MQLTIMRFMPSESKALPFLKNLLTRASSLISPLSNSTQAVGSFKLYSSLRDMLKKVGTSL